MSNAAPKYSTILDCAAVMEFKEFKNQLQSQKSSINTFNPKTIAVAGTLALAAGITAGLTDESHTASVLNNAFLGESSSISGAEPSITLGLPFQLVNNAINSAKYESFESGMESDFGRFIKRLVMLYGHKGLNALDICLSNRALSFDIVAEGVRALGEMDHSSTKLARFTMLLRYLDHPSPIVRDAVALAFADLNDKGAISYLRAASKREKFSAIRSSFLSVAKELEEA